MSRWYYGWNVVLLTLVFQAVSIGILIYSFALFVLPWLDLFETSRRDIMLAIVALQIGTGLISPVVGLAMDRLKIRYLVMAGGVILGLGFTLLSMATSFWQVVVLYASLLPVGMVLTGPLAAQTLVTRWFVHRRGLAIGISAMGTSIGGFLFPLICTSLIETLGWRSTLQVLAALTVLLIPPSAWLILRRDPPQEPPGAATAARSVREHAWTTRGILTTSIFWLPVLGFISLNAAFGGVQFNLGAFVQDLGHEPARAAMLISLTSVAMIFGKLMFGTLADIVDHRKLYWFTALLMGTALFLIQDTPNLNLLLAGSIFFGLATGGILPLTGVIYSSRFGVESFGRVMGMVTMFMMVGSFGSVFAGWIFDVTGSYDLAFQIFLVLLVPPAVAMFWLRQPQDLKHSKTSANPEAASR